MEDIMESSDSNQPEVQVEEVATPIKKKLSPRKIVFSLVILLVIIGIAGTGVYKFLRSSSQVKHISKDALMVAKIDLPKMLMKADMKELKGKKVNEDLQKFLEELNIEALLKAPKSTGLLTIKPSYMFVEYDKKLNDLMYFAVIPIANGTKVASFFKKVTPLDNSEIKIRTKDDKHIWDSAELAVVWNKSSLMVGYSAKANAEEMQRIVSKYLDQTKSSSIAANKEYKKSHRSSHDLSLWINLDGIAKVADQGFKDAKPKVEKMIEQMKQYDAAMQDFRANYIYYYSNGIYQPNLPTLDRPGNVFENILYEATNSSGDADYLIKQIKQLDKSSAIVFADFEKGEFVSGVKAFVSPEQQKKLRGIESKLVAIKPLAKYIPKDGLVSTAAIQVNYDKAWSLSEDQIKKLLKKTPPPELDKLLKQAKTLCDGSFIISMNHPGKKKEPFFTIVASTKKNRGIEDILQQQVKEGNIRKEGKLYFQSDLSVFFEGDVMVLTTDYREYKKSEYGLDGKSLKALDSKPLAMFFDMPALVDIAGDEMENEVEDLLNMIKSISVKSKLHNGIPDEISVEIQMTDAKKNSLKVLWDRLAEEDIFAGLSSMIPRDRVEPELPEYDAPAVDTTMVVPEPNY